jgi:hypothetical protein
MRTLDRFTCSGSEILEETFRHLVQEAGRSLTKTVMPIFIGRRARQAFEGRWKPMARQKPCLREWPRVFPNRSSANKRSLVRLELFPFPRENFPVPVFREIAPYLLIYMRKSRVWAHFLRQNWQIFLYFPLNSEYAFSETSSQMTASTASCAENMTKRR